MPKWEYEERRTLARFLCIVSPILNFLHSHDDCFAALQIVCPPELADWRISPALSFHCLIGSFLSFQFHDLNMFVNSPTKRG